MARARLFLMRKSYLTLLTALLLAGGSCESERTSGPSSTASLVEAGWSFGFCLGPCRGDLQVAGSALTYRVSDRANEEVLATARGTLTPRGLAALESLASALPEELQDTYGCPDCADAGAAYLVVAREGGSKRTNYEYPNPPPELTAIDAFLKSLFESFRLCRGTEDVVIDAGCQPLP